jgi:hypothetical protein
MPVLHSSADAAPEVSSASQTEYMLTSPKGDDRTSDWVAVRCRRITSGPSDSLLVSFLLHRRFLTKGVDHVDGQIWDL